MQAAVAWGLKARISKKIKDAKESKKYIDQTLNLYPESPWGLAALGGWHGEVVQNAGGLMAGIIFGGKRKISLSSFEKSIELAENKIPFYLAYAQSLLRYKKKKYYNEARKFLEKISPLTPQNYLDQISKLFATETLLALNKNDSDRLKTLIDGFAKPPREEEND